MKKIIATLLLIVTSNSLAFGSGLKNVEIIEGWKNSDSSIVLGLKISLNDGWTTYWHTPGPIGLKPKFDFSNSVNISKVEVLWPGPKVFGTSGFEYIGYEDEVVLPLTLEAKISTEPINLKITGNIGVCYDVCVPIEFKLQSGLKTITREINPDLLAALTSLPLSPSDFGKQKASCSLTFGENSFKITANIPYLVKPESQIYFSIKDYRHELSIEQPSLVIPGKPISAIGEWHDEAHLKVQSDLITITQIYGDEVIEQKGC